MDPDLLDEEELPENTSTKPRFAGGYDELKTFKGQYYAGMAIVEPDLWKVDFQTTKRRDRKAPQGSGAPVGTEYRWLIVAHQVCFSLPYKLAHKNAASEKWSIGTVMGHVAC
ncbi:hypothetical protein V1523DRAFT_416970 [Lipomyces doorenjongii]